MSYKIEITSKAIKVLKKLPKELVEELNIEIEKLKDNPYPPGYAKLKGQKKESYRIKYKDWRIIYAIEKKELIILIVNIGPRKDIYK